MDRVQEVRHGQQWEHRHERVGTGQETDLKFCLGAGCFTRNTIQSTVSFVLPASVPPLFSPALHHTAKTSCRGDVS